MVVVALLMNPREFGMGHSYKVQMSIRFIEQDDRLLRPAAGGARRVWSASLTAKSVHQAWSLRTRRAILRRPQAEVSRALNCVKLR